MEKFKKHAPVLMFVLVLAGCAGLIVSNYDKPAEMLAETKFDQSVNAVTSKLNAKEVEPDYIFSEQKKEELKKLPETVDKNVARLTRTSDAPVGTYVAYPQPARPRSEIVVPGALPVDKYAFNPGLPQEKIKTHVDINAVYLEFRVPQFDPKESFTELVRAEIFRGTDPKSIDTSKPYGIVELGPEEAPPPSTNAAPASPAQPIDGRPRPKAPTQKSTRVEVPKDLRAFHDSKVEQLTTYFYQIRLVVRFTGTEGKFLPKLDAQGIPIPGDPGFTLHSPDKHPTLGKNYLPAPSKSGAPLPLFALPLTAPVKAETPFTFTIRLEGVNGTPPPPDVIRDPKKPEIRDYEARFEIGVWRPDMEKLNSTHITAKEGDTLGESEGPDGKPKQFSMNYLAKGTGEKRSYEFSKDLGYKFIKITQEPDPKPKFPGQMQTVAIVENLRTKKEEHIAQLPQPKSREEILTVIDQWLADEAAKKK